MARAFVTGITGQTGSYLAELLIDNGWTVHGLVRPADASREVLEAVAPGATLHTGDLSDLQGLSRLIDRLEPAVVFNLGGISSVARSWTDPVETASITGMPIVAILESSLRVQERTGSPVAVVQASSAEIFGDAPYVPQDERTPIRPSNPYGAAKAYGHHLVRIYRERGLGAASCILFNHESPRRPANFVTRKITLAAARIRLGLQERLTLGNLEARRDWGWAPDYAQALVAAASRPDDYVIATGVAHSVGEFASTAFAVVGIDDWESRIDVDPALLRLGDTPDQVGDATKAHQALGWTPTKTFEQIVEAMVEADLMSISSGH